MSSDIFTTINEINISLTNSSRTIELSRLILNIELYESIFDFFLNGKLTIVDTLDLMQNFPIIGNESLSITLHTTDADTSIRLDFIVYKIDKERPNRGDTKRKLINLYFCSAEAIKNNITRISKKFEATAETIIKEVISTYYGSGKKLTSDPTSSNLTVFSNFWNGSRLIDFILRNSTDGTNNDFLFYESFNGFHFQSISNLISQSSVANITSKTDIDSVMSNTNIKVYKFDSYFDTNKMSSVGLFGSSFYKPSDTNYGYTLTQTTLNENYNSIQTNGASQHFNSNLFTNQNMVETNFYNPEVSQVRLASINLLKNYNFVMRMNGSLNRSVGNNLNISFPNLDNVSASEVNFGGMWIILGIRHIIDQNNGYFQNVLVAKNAFFKNSDLTNITSRVNA